MPTPRAPHVVVIGAGVVGVCCAERLATRGAQVTVLDSGRIGAGCSGGPAGLISLGHAPIPAPGVIWRALGWMLDAQSPLYIAPRLDPALLAWLWRFRAACAPAVFERNMLALCALCDGARELFDEYHTRANGAYFYRNQGYYEVFRTHEGLAGHLPACDAASRHGYEYEQVSGDELRAREPALCGEVHGAIHWPKNAFCEPLGFVRAVAALAREAGATIREETHVAGVTPLEGIGVALALSNGERLDADSAVIATGAWAPDLLRTLGVHAPIQPAKGYHQDIPESDPPLTAACMFGEAGMVATPMGGFLRLAGTLEFSGRNAQLRRARLDMLRAGARKYLASLNGAAPMREWVGLRPCLPDGLPMIGPAPRAQNVYIATGHAMLGLTHAPTTGKAISELILDGRARLDLAPFGVGRF